MIKRVKKQDVEYYKKLIALGVPKSEIGYWGNTLMVSETGLKTILDNPEIPQSMKTLINKILVTAKGA